MTMKQTQTKVFDFSDIGLDFSAGSKNLFPERFKRVLSAGYNVQTVSSVSVTGNQVTLTYGVAHGYAAERVLKVDSGALAAINNGEFWIDSVTANTLTLTIDDAPQSITGLFTTRIAPLGYDLVYEQNNIYVYKFKHFDNTDLFLRLCFQNVSNARNVVCPCIGKTFDIATGFITDPLALTENAQIMSPSNKFQWEYSRWAEASTNNSTYSEAVQWFGKGVFVGSLYHFLSLHNVGGSNSGRFIGFLPTLCHNYNVLDYPLIIGETGSFSSDGGVVIQYVNGAARIGNIAVQFESQGVGLATVQSSQSFLSSAIDTFNTTTAQPFLIYEKSTRQYLGAVRGGAYLCKYASGTNRPPIEINQTPSITNDIDFNHKCFIHYYAVQGNGVDNVFFAVPVEVIRED